MMKLYNSFDKYDYSAFKNIEVSSEFDYRFHIPDGWEMDKYICKLFGC